MDKDQLINQLSSLQGCSGCCVAEMMHADDPKEGVEYITAPDGNKIPMIYYKAQAAQMERETKLQSSSSFGDILDDIFSGRFNPF